MEYFDTYYFCSIAQYLIEESDLDFASTLAEFTFVSSNRWQLFFVFQNDIFYLILGSPNKPLLAFFYQ